MSRPITWQNIQGPAANSIGAERGYAAAVDGVTGGLDRLANIFTSQEALATAAQEREREAQALGFRNMLNEARTVGELDAMRADGRLAAAYGALDPRTQARVIGAPDARRAGLIQETTNNDAFQAAQLEKEQAPLVNQIKSLIAKRNFAGANELLEANPQIRNAAALFNAKLQGRRAVVTEGRQDTEFGWREREQRAKADEEAYRAATRPGALELQRFQIEEAKAEAAQRPARQAAAALASATAARAAELERERKALEASGNPYVQRGVFSEAATPNLLKLMRDNKVGDDDKERAAVVSMLNNYRFVRGNQNIPVPLSVVESAILGSYENIRGSGFGFGDQGWARNIKEALDARMSEIAADARNPNIANPVLVEQFRQFNRHRENESLSPTEPLRPRPANSPSNGPRPVSEADRAALTAQIQQLLRSR